MDQAATDGDIGDLRRLGEELAAAEAGPFEPADIGRLFSRSARPEFEFTMQAWIDLSAAESPLLLGVFPDADGAAALEAMLGDALAAFGRSRDMAGSLEPGEAVVVMGRMLRSIADGFSAAVRMRPAGACATGTGGGGFGAWLPIYCCLVTQCGLGPEAALAMPVGRAYALIAGMRWNQGWECAGESYRQRDALRPERPAAPEGAAEAGHDETAGSSAGSS